MDKKTHWENIYQSKTLQEVSWYQPTPTTSLDFLKQYRMPLEAKIIDVGGGDSLLVDHLLDLGYTDVTILDISASSLERAKKRLGERAQLVKWIIADASDFQPTEQYDFWHDRAAFHFLTQEDEINHYIDSVRKGLAKQGILVLGTFSEQGPTTCSGIEIKQYSQESMIDLLKRYFEKIKCVTVNHETPFHTVQNFVFCLFRKLAS